MFTNKMRPAFLTAIVLVGIATLVITVSPTVRATIFSIFTINGVEVGQDEETGELIIEGNPDAIIYQDEDTVIIDESSEDEPDRYTIIKSRLMLPENFPIEELETLYPEFTMPTNLPDGYELIPVAFKLDQYGVGVGVGWMNSDEHQITYMWNESTPVDFSDEELDALEERGYTVERDTPPQFLETFEQFSDVVILSDISDDGINQSLSSTDVSFTEEELRAMLP